MSKTVNTSATITKTMTSRAALNALINSPSSYEENIKFEILTVIF